MSTVIDYAAPMMRIESLLKAMHNDLLEKDISAAGDKATLLIVESRILLNTLIIMQQKEHENALRQQAPTLQERVSTTDCEGGNPGQAGTPESASCVGQEGHCAQGQGCGACESAQ